MAFWKAKFQNYGWQSLTQASSPWAAMWLTSFKDWSFCRWAHSIYTHLFNAVYYFCLLMAGDISTSEHTHTMYFHWITDRVSSSVHPFCTALCPSQHLMKQCILPHTFHLTKKELLCFSNTVWQNWPSDINLLRASSYRSGDGNEFNSNRT